MTATRALLMLMTLGLSACGGDKGDATDGADGGDGSDGADGSDGTDGTDGTDGGDGADGADGGDGTEPLQQACETGEEGSPATFPATRMSASVTWTLSYDSGAEAGGYTDCSYSRDYDGLQAQGFEHLCPDCTVITRGDATFTDGVDCFEAFTGSATDPTRVEWWGVTAAGGLHRTGADQAPMGELTTFSGSSGDGSPVAIAWESTYEIGGGNVTLSAAGTLSWEEDGDTMLTDFWGPRADPYACEWECNDPGDLAGDYDLQTGDVMPNFRLQDQCGEWVDLHDFAGSYVVLDTSQFDCGPCRSMAQTEEAFLEEMRSRGVAVRVLTLMGDGLGDPYGTPDASTVDWWINEYGLTDPVLYDRGYAYALFPQYIYDSTGEDFGYPAWLVLDPQMQVISGNVGFSSWDAVIDIIEGDRAR